MQEKKSWQENNYKGKPVQRVDYKQLARNDSSPAALEGGTFYALLHCISSSRAGRWCLAFATGDRIFIVTD